MLMSAEFWVALSFVAFLAILAYMKVPGMLAKALDDRALGIKTELDQARRIREEAQDLLADYQQKQRQAEDEAKAIVEQARREAENLRRETEKNLKESVERRARLADEKIARAEAQAVSEVRAAAIDLAAVAAERILKSQVTRDAGSGLVDQSIRDLRGKLN